MTSRCPHRRHPAPASPFGHCPLRHLKQEGDVRRPQQALADPEGHPAPEQVSQQRIAIGTFRWHLHLDVSPNWHSGFSPLCRSASLSAVSNQARVIGDQSATTRSCHFPSSHLHSGYRPGVLLLGLTGGIGSGKSTVAALLAALGAVLVDADIIAREVVEPGGPAYQPMIERFGSEIVRPDGTLDRPAIAKRVFNDPAALADLNAITHPPIREEIGKRVMEQATTDKVVVLDVPLLTETTNQQWGLAGVIVVDAPEEVALDRLVTQRGLKPEDAEARIKAQATREERRKLADVVVDNSQDKAHLEREVRRAWEWIQAREG
jgi:dephospho-CoA kinase